MEKLIILNFPPKIPREEKNHLSQLVNNALKNISHEVAAWNGFVDVLLNEQNGYTLIGIADDAATRDKMQELLEKIEVNVYNKLAS